MPLTPAGIYYPNADTNVNLSQITQTVAESIDDNLGIVKATYGFTNVLVTNSSSSVFGNSGLKASITPNSTTNGVLIIVRMPFESSATLGYASGAVFELRRGNTTIATSAPGLVNVNDQPNGSATLFASTLALTYIDFPATTNTIEYSIWGRMQVNTPTPSAQQLSMNYADGAALSTITLFEVAR